MFSVWSLGRFWGFRVYRARGNLGRDVLVGPFHELATWNRTGPVMWIAKYHFSSLRHRLANTCARPREFVAVIAPQPQTLNSKSPKPINPINPKP